MTSPGLLLAHEWLSPTGGSENVFEELSDLLRPARRVCLWNDAPERFADVEETWLARTPVRRSKAAAVVAAPAAWRRVRLGDAATVLASSHATSHRLARRAVAEGRDGFAYVHTPARYLWTPDLDQRGAAWPVRAAAPTLRRVDRAAVHPGVRYAANSEFVRQRIRACWDVEATVIHPPVDVVGLQSRSQWADLVPSHEQEVLANLPEQFVLGASRLVPYKRVDLAIRAAAALDLPAVVSGSGPDRPRLEALADEVRVPVQFVGEVSTPLLRTLFQRALLYVFLPVEDFGIMAVEAIALGVPTLVDADGGAREIVAATGGGAAVSGPPTRADLDRALAAPMETAARRALEFDRAVFRRQVAAWVGAGSGAGSGGPTVRR